MPIYEYICQDCGNAYEQLVMSKSSKIACPQCDSGRHTLKLSVFSASGNSAKSNGQSFGSSRGCGCTPKTCGCH